jgi:DNA-binding response OmpR family regulator
MELAEMADTMPACRVLIVEDEMLIAMMLQDMVSDAGLEVEGVANSLNAGIDLAKRADFDLAILDVNLNGEEVYPVAEILKQRGIPFIFSTGYGAGGLKSGFDGAPQVVKPFQQKLLMAAVKAALE